jgi:putative ABC transport system permease protein
VYRDFVVNIIDEDFIPSMGITVLQGRNFNKSNPSDPKNAIVVNEAFVKEYGWTDPIGKAIPGKNYIAHEIIGVVKDFHFASLYSKVEPLVMSMNAAIPFSGSENVMMDNSPIPKLFVRLQAEKLTEGVVEIESTWKKLFGDEPFSFSFVDERIEAQYRADQNLARVINIGTVLAIFIGALGLYALASLAIQSRIKEVSIRKLLGATVSSLLILLSKDFLLLIFISIAVSVPITLYFMQEWLQSFEYRITISPATFVVAAIAALLVGLFAISTEAVRTAITKPAERLKEE